MRSPPRVPRFTREERREFTSSRYPTSGTKICVRHPHYRSRKGDPWEAIKRRDVKERLADWSPRCGFAEGLSPAARARGRWGSTGPLPPVPSKGHGGAHRVEHECGRSWTTRRRSDPNAPGRPSSVRLWRRSSICLCRRHLARKAGVQPAPALDRANEIPARFEAVDASQ